MNLKKEKQTIISDFETKQIGVSVEAYNILFEVKTKLIEKNKKNFTFSDAVIELKRTSTGSNIQFSNKEIAQIKTVLKGGIFK